MEGAESESRGDCERTGGCGDGQRLSLSVAEHSGVGAAMAAARDPDGTGGGAGPDDALSLIHI
eukprot:1075843-Rhodomonas_salina.1